MGCIDPEAIQGTTLPELEAISLEPSIFLAPLKGLLNTFQKERHYKDDKKDAALLAIQAALLQTRRYIEKSGGDKSFDRDEEYRIASLWAEAAVKARHVSSDVALRLNDKSTYWSDRFEWSREEVIERAIDLASIEHDLNALLGR